MALSMIEQVRVPGALRSTVISLCALVGVAALVGCGKEESKRPAADTGVAGSNSATAGTEQGGVAPVMAGAGGAGTGPLGVAGSAGTAPVSTASGGSAGSSTVLGGSGGTNSASGGTTESTGGTSSLATGQECTGDADCSIADLCAVDSGAVVGVCRPRCLAADVGSAGSCADGQICAYDQSLVRASCHSVCAATDAGLEGCVAPDACRLAPDPAVTGEEAVTGLCLRLGSTEQGKRCSEGDCAAGLECIALSSGLGFCQPYCDSTAAAATPGACAEGQSCVEGASGRTGCVQSCSVLLTGECPAGQACVLDGSEEAFAGRCVAAGSLGPGDECARGDCAEGLICAPAPSPFAGAEFTCQAVCQTTGSAPCAASEVCVQASTEATGVGTCVLSCELLSEGTAAGCLAGEWCAPATDLVGVGVCVPTLGSGASGAACSVSRDCAPGLYCNCRFGLESSCLGEATCEPICLPQAAAGELGSCAATEACAAETDGGVLFPFGTCGETCDFSASSACTVSEETCSPSPYDSNVPGVCLDTPQPYLTIGEPCELPALNLHERCGPASICEFDPVSQDVVCQEICRVSEGALGSTAHPDCSDASAVCMEIAGVGAFGYCGSGS